DGEVGGGTPAGDAGRERRRDRERGGEALRHALERGYSVHGAMAVVTAPRAQIHCAGRAARMRAGRPAVVPEFAGSVSKRSFRSSPRGAPRDSKSAFTRVCDALCVAGTSLRGPSPWPWIPAFAGMSGVCCAFGVSPKVRRYARRSLLVRTGAVALS